METENLGSNEPAARGERLVPDPLPATTDVGYTSTYREPIATGQNVMTVRNLVQWGPIIAGLATAIATFLLLTVLGIAMGASVLDADVSGEDIGTWAAFWGAISAILSFLVGGWVAAKTAAVGGSFGGLMNGFLVGAAGLILVLWLTANGLGNIFGTLSSNIGDILNVAQETAQDEGVTTGEAQQEAAQAEDEATEAVDEAEQTLRASFDDVKDGAFGTFLGLLLPLIAAALGGFLGRNTRQELIEGTD